jgi:hypothetical protein
MATSLMTLVTSLAMSSFSLSSESILFLMCDVAGNDQP